ncbi:MAG: hypothetical protein RIQ65_691 [Pseudomonadota bacterium]|jgi:hypothetical protein
MQKEIIRSYLDIKSLNQLLPASYQSQNILVEAHEKPNFKLCKFFYKEIGKDFFWKDRLRWNDQQWIDYVGNKFFKLYILKYENHFAGYYELLFDKSKKSMEIAYFGIFKEYYGKGIGGYLLTDAILNSFKQDIESVWVHTCTLDHPNALKNYLARGMKIFKTEKIFFNPENL